MAVATRTFAVAALVVLVGGASTRAHAKEPSPSSADSPVPVAASTAAPVPPAAPARDATPPSAPPSFLSGKRKMSPHDAETKNEGTYPTGLPLVSSDPDTGFGLGAVAYLFWNGARTDPLFDYTPYRHRLAGQVFFTTNGLQQHVVDYDAPYLGGSPFRLRALAMYERNTSENYFGRGAATLAHLSYTGAGRSFATIGDYTAALRRLGAGNVAHTLYNKYDLEDPNLRTTVERDFLGGVVRVQVGLGVSYVRVRDYTGAGTVGDDPASGQTGVSATMATTRLREDCDAARIVGCAGGIHNTIKLGIAFDTRDYEPDPHSGVFVDLTGEMSSRAIGSAYDYVRVTVAPRVFVTPLPALVGVVLAARAVYSVQSDGVPFFAMNTLAFTDGDRQGLGGIWTLRGFNQDRFVGPISVLANLELRWTFIGFHVIGQNFALSVAPFFDTGRVFDRVADFSFADWKWGAGAGLHIAWNKATIIVLDYGVSTEGSTFYIGVGQQF